MAHSELRHLASNEPAVPSGKKVIWVLDNPLDPITGAMQFWKIKRQIAEGTKVDVALCGESVGACYANPFGVKRICSYCRQHVNVLARNVSAKLIDLDQLQLPKQNGRPDGAVGKNWYVESTFASKFRVTAENAGARILERAHREITRAYGQIERRLGAIVDDKSYDEVWTFNGRLNISGAAIECAKRARLPYATFELTALDYKVNVTRNLSNFDLNAWTDKFSGLMRQISRREVRKGAEFFAAKLKGIPTNDHAYYTPKAIPPDLRDVGRLDALFLLSSDDERTNLGGEWKQFFDSQEDVCLFVRKHFPNWNMAVRYHPNQGGVRPELIRNSMDLLKRNGFRVYGPRSDVASYDLLTRTDLVITFGSTIGSEAMYMRKRVIECARSYTSGMRLLTWAKSYDDLLALLKAPYKIAIKRYRAVAYAYFLMYYTSEPCDQAYMTDYAKGRLRQHLSWFGRLYCWSMRNFEILVSGRPFNLVKRTRRFLRRKWAKTGVYS